MSLNQWTVLAALISHPRDVTSPMSRLDADGRVGNAIYFILLFFKKKIVRNVVTFESSFNRTARVFGLKGISGLFFNEMTTLWVLEVCGKTI